MRGILLRLRGNAGRRHPRVHGLLQRLRHPDDLPLRDAGEEGQLRQHPLRLRALRLGPRQPGAGRPQAPAGRQRRGGPPVDGVLGGRQGNQGLRVAADHGRGQDVGRAREEGVAAVAAAAAGPAAAAAAAAAAAQAQEQVQHAVGRDQVQLPVQGLED